MTAATRAPWFCSKGVTAPTLWTYLALSFLAVGSRLGIVAVLGSRTLAGQFILSQRLRLRLGLGRLWRRLAGSASPLGPGDGLRARRNSLHIHLHLPIHWRARQKPSGDLAAARGGSSAARGTHGSPRRGRLPRALPPAALRPRSPRLRSPARLGHWRRRGRGARARAAACPWSGGLQAPPAAPPSRAQPAAAAPPSRAPSPGGARGLALPSGLPIPVALPSLSRGPSACPLPSHLVNKVTGRANPRAGSGRARRTALGNGRGKCGPPCPPAGRAPAPHLWPLPDAREPRKGGYSDLCEAVAAAARTGRRRASGGLVTGAPTPRRRRPPPPLWRGSSSRPPARGRARVGVSGSGARVGEWELPLLRLLRRRPRASQPRTSPGGKGSQPSIPGRKSTSPPLRPQRGLEAGRGGAPRGWPGREARSAPEFGVKVGSGGSMGEAEGEARSRRQAVYPGGGRQPGAAAPSRGASSPRLEGRPQQARSPGGSRGDPRPGGEPRL